MVIEEGWGKARYTQHCTRENLLLDPYIYFITEYSHLAAIPIVGAALYGGWRKGFLGLEGTPLRNLIGVEG